MSHRAQDAGSSPRGSSSITSRVFALLGVARHGPFSVQAKKVVQLLQAPSAHVRCSGLRKLQQLLLQFRHLPKERQVSVELLLLALEHGNFAGADGGTDPAAAIATAFTREQQLPCAAFLQPPAAAAAAEAMQEAAATATEDSLRLTCRTEALGCLIELIPEGALGTQQLIDALHARLAAAGSSSNSSSRSTGGLLPPQLQLVLVQRLLGLALEDKLLPYSSQQPQQEQQMQQGQLARTQQAAAALRDALIRISHFCPRVCLAAVEAVASVLEAEAHCSSSSSDSTPQDAFEVLLEPTLVVSLQLLLGSSSSSAANSSLIPLAVTRLLRCANAIERAELQRAAMSQQQQQQGSKSDKLLHLSLSAFLRIEDVEEFCCCFSAALQCAQLSAVSISALQRQGHKQEDDRALQQLQKNQDLQLQQQQQQARVDRLLWECLCRLYAVREQQQDPTSLLKQLLSCLGLFAPLKLHAAAVAAAGCSDSSSSNEGSSSSNNEGSSSEGSSSSSCLSVGLWRVACACVGWLLWSAAPSAGNAVEVLLLLQAVGRLLQLQPQLLLGPSGASSKRTNNICMRSCSQRMKALRLISCVSPLLLLLLPLVTQQQIGAGGARCATQLAKALQQVTLRLHALLSCAAAAAASAAAAAAAEGDSACCSMGCCFSCDVEELFGLSGSVGQTSGAVAAMPLSFALWAFRVLDWGAAEQLLGRQALVSAEQRQRTKQQDRHPAAAAAARARTPVVVGQQQMFLHALLRGDWLKDLHSPLFLLSLPSSLLQQGPYAFLLACCFMAEALDDRQQAFAAVNALVAAAPAAALQLLPALHFAAARPPMSPLLHALLRWKFGQQQQLKEKQQHKQQQPLLPDSLILFDGEEALATKALASVGTEETGPCASFSSSAAAERWQLLRSLSRVFALSLQALASLGLHKSAVLPVYRALHDLLPLQQQQQHKPSQVQQSLSSVEDEWLCAALGSPAPTELHALLCSHGSGHTNAGDDAAACSSCCCCRKCCWCGGDSFGLLASRVLPVVPHSLLSANGRWFLLMRNLSRLAAFDELPYTKLTASAPGNQENEEPPGGTAAGAGGKAGASQGPEALEEMSSPAPPVSASPSVPFVLPTNASPLQKLLLAFCLQRLESVCPRALLQFLPAMQELVSSCGPCPSLQLQQNEQQQERWLVDRACALTLSTLGRLCMRRFLESRKILRVLRRKCPFLFDTLRAPPPALEGYVLILYALAQDLAEQIEQEQQEDEPLQERADSGLSPELEAQVQEQLLLLEEVAEASPPFARSVALQAASLILGPLYAASIETATGSVLRAAAGEGTSVRFACSEGIGGVVLHLPLRQMEVRGAAALLAAAMSKERVARGIVHAQTPAELLGQQKQQTLGTLLARNADATAPDLAGDAQSERAVLRLLFFSKPRKLGNSGGNAQEARETKELRAHAQQEARDIARHFMSCDPLLLMLLPRLCGFFVRRFAALLPASVAADRELLQLGQQMLQQLEALLPHAAGDEQNAAAASGVPSPNLPSQDRTSSTRSEGLGMRLPEFTLLASLLSALAAQHPALTPAILNFFSLRLHASAAAPPPPWLSSCLLLAFAPLHAASADVSALWTEPQEGQEGEEVFAAILRGTGGSSISPLDIQKCLCGAAFKAANDLVAIGRCIFLASHAQHYSGDRMRLESCVNAILAASAPLGKPHEAPQDPNTADAKLPAVVTAGLAVAIAEVSRVVHLQAPDPRPFYPQLFEVYKNLELVLLASNIPQSFRWNALLTLGSLVPILLEAGILPLDEAIYLLQRVEEILQHVQPEPSTLAYAGIAHLTHSLLLLLLQHKRKPQRLLRVQHQTAELQRLLLHFEGTVRRWLAAPAVGATAQLSRALAAAALMGAPFLLMPPTRVAAAQRNTGSSGLTSVSFALAGADQTQDTNASEQQQQPTNKQQQKAQDASAVAVDTLMEWLSGKAANASLISFGVSHGGQPPWRPGNRIPDLAGSMLLSLLYVELTNITAEGSLASLQEKSLTRVALQRLLQIRDGQDLLLPEPVPSTSTYGSGADAAAVEAAVALARDPFCQQVCVPEEVDEAASESVEALGWMGLVAGRAVQKASSRGNGLPVPHCTCLLEALASRGVPPFAELQLSKRLALLFSRSLEVTSGAIRRLFLLSGHHVVQGIPTPIRPSLCAVGDSGIAFAPFYPHLLLQQLQACCSLQLAVMRFCCRHCYRLPHFAALLVEFAQAGFGIGAAAQQQRQQQRQRRFTAAVALFFFALLPAAAGALSARDLSSLLGGILLRGLLPPVQEPALWCSALNALRRILESARLGVCCSGRDTQQRKRWEQQQQQQREQRRLHFCQVENEVPCYVFASVSHKLRFFREIQQLIMLWILPLLTGTDSSAGGQKPAASTGAAAAPAAPGVSTQSSIPAAAAAAAAARKVPFAVWGTAAEALISYLLLRKDCLLLQAVLDEEDVASLPTAELQSRRRQQFVQKQEQEVQELIEGLALLPAVVVVYLVLSGVAPLELIYRKRTLLVRQPAPFNCSNTSVPASGNNNAVSVNAYGSHSSASTEFERDDAISWDDDLTTEVAALCYACSWLPHKEQVELLEAFACNSSSSGSKTCEELGISARRCFVGFVVLAAHMVTAHQAAFMLQGIAETDAFTTGCTNGNQKSGNLSNTSNCSTGAVAGGQQGCSCQWVQNCGGISLSFCGELAAFPSVCADALEREDSIYAQVAEARCMYTSQQGIKHLIGLQHRWICFTSGSSRSHQCCCSVGSAKPLGQIVLGAANGEARSVGYCLEPLLLRPAAFAGVRGFYCLNLVPNLYYLSSLSSQPIQLQSRALAVGKAPTVPAASGMAGSSNNSSISSKRDAASLCNELVANHEKGIRLQKKAIYGDECHEGIILERRDSILLQSHLPSSLMMQDTPCTSPFDLVAPACRRRVAAAGTLLAVTEALAPTVVRHLHEQSRRCGNSTPPDAVVAGYGRPGSSLPERLRHLAAMLQRMLTETQLARKLTAQF